MFTSDFQASAQPVAQPAASAQPVRIVIADDHELVRAGMRALLDQHEDFLVVAEARDGHQLLALLDQVEADLVLCDLNMPRMDGMECVAQIHKSHPHLRVIMLSMDETPAAVRMATSRGAAGYLVKQAASMELAIAVSTVAQGGRYLSPIVTRNMLREPQQDSRDCLTERQVEVLTHVAQGRSSREIGTLLGLSSKTVDAHRSRIQARLELRDVAGMTRYAIKHGLLR